MQLVKRLMPLSILTICLSLASFGCEKSNQNVQAARENRDANTIGAADKAFLTEAEQDGIKERNLGRVVLEKSSNSDVKDYAQMLVDDHTKALRDLIDLMNEKAMRQPKGLPEVKHEALGKLNGYSGKEFDREFIRIMVDDHEKAVAKFSQMQNTAQDEFVRNYARKVLPALEKHLRKAQELQSKLANEKTKKSAKR